MTQTIANMRNIPATTGDKIAHLEEVLRLTLGHKLATHLSQQCKQQYCNAIVELLFNMKATHLMATPVSGLLMVVAVISINS